MAKPAMRKLNHLDGPLKLRIRKRLRQLAADPFNPTYSKPLNGLNGLRSSRVGDWRILYTLDEVNSALFVTAIRPRGDAYR
ncbi:MAG: type II toxin-antitoxin system RelE/ParE family toxin [Acidobacteriia bacterium]|nr:type II toxin-antitoxin system RelE/ParE family toxin [Terriglobia bacterium]